MKNGNFKWFNLIRISCRKYITKFKIHKPSLQTEKKNYPGVTNQEETKNVVVATVEVS